MATKSNGLQLTIFETPESPRPFRKGVELVHSVPDKNLTVVERRIQNLWLQWAAMNPPDDDGWWSMPINELSKDAITGSRNLTLLKEAARNQMKVVYEWDMLPAKHSHIRYKASVLFPEVEIYRNLFRFQISPEMRSVVLDPHLFALIDNTIIKRFARGSSTALFEFCMRYVNLPQTAAIEWQLLRDMLCGKAPQVTLQAYKYFKARVLNPAMKEVNELAPFEVELVETHAGRSISDVQFKIKQKHTAHRELLDEQALYLVKGMSDLGVPLSEARRIVQTYTNADVAAALAFTKKRCDDRRSTHLTNPAAYFRKALQQGYASAGAPTKGKTAEREATPAVDLTALWMTEQQPIIRAYYRELSPDDQNGLINQYNQQQTIANLRLRHNRKNAVAEGPFFDWVIKTTWGDPSAQDLLAFASLKLAGNKN